MGAEDGAADPGRVSLGLGGRLPAGPLRGAPQPRSRKGTRGPFWHQDVSFVFHLPSLSSVMGTVLLLM